MHRSLTISPALIDEPSLVAARANFTTMGATVYFSGMVRGSEAATPISALEYECFRPMAEHQFHQLFDELERRWPIASVRLVHRIGVVKTGEASLWVELVAPHRGEAFAACQWLIEEMKRVVPIWKKPLPE